MPADNSNAFSPQDLTRTEDQNRAFPNARGQVVPTIESAPEEPQDWKTPMAEPEGGWQQEGTPLTIQARPKEVNKILNSKHVLSDVDTSDPSNARVFVANFLNSKYDEDKRGIYKDYEGKTKAYGLSGDPVADAKSILEGDTKTHENSQTRIAKDRKVIAEGLDKLGYEERQGFGANAKNTFDRGFLDLGVGTAAQGTLKGIESMGDEMERIERGLFEDMGLTYYDEELGDPLTSEDVQKWREDVRERNTVDPEFLNSYTGGVIQGYGQAAAIVPAFLLNPTLGTGMSVAQAYQYGEDGYRDFVKSEGITYEESEARKAGLWNMPSAAVDVIANRFAIGKILKPLKGAKITKGGALEFLKDTAESAAMGSGTEGVQTVWENLNAKYLSGYDRDKVLTDGVVDAMVIGAFVDSTITAGGQGVTKGVNKLLGKTMDPIEGMTSVDWALALNVVPEAEFAEHVEREYGDEVTEDGVPLAELAWAARGGDRKAAEALVDAVTLEVTVGAKEAGLTPAEAEARGKEAAEVADPVEPLVETAIDKEISAKKEELAALEEAEGAGIEAAEAPSSPYAEGDVDENGVPLSDAYEWGRAAADRGNYRTPEKASEAARSNVGDKRADATEAGYRDQQKYNLDKRVQSKAGAKDMKKYEKLDKEIQALEAKRDETQRPVDVLSAQAREEAAAEEAGLLTRRAEEEIEIDKAEEVADAIDFFEQRSRGGVTKDYKPDTRKGGETLIKQMRRAGMSKEEIAAKSLQIMTEAGRPQDRLSDQVVRGEQTSNSKAGNDFRATVKLYKDADPMDVAEEYIHAETDREVNEGTINYEDIAAYRKQVESITSGEDTRGDTEGDHKEWIAEQVKARLLGNRHDTRLPESFARFIDRIISRLRNLFTRANELIELEAQGMLPDGFVELLDRLGSMDDDALMQSIQAEQAAETSSDPKDELLEVMKRNKLSVPRPDSDPSHRGELETYFEGIGKKWKYLKKGGSLDGLKEGLQAAGFNVDTPSDVLDLLDRSARGEAIYANTDSRSAAQQTADETFSLSPAEANDILEGAEYIEPEDLFDAEITGPVVVLGKHGSTHGIDKFTSSRANMENDWGAAIYASTSDEDVNENYAGVGPDLTNRIEREMEQLEREMEDDPEEYGLDEDSDFAEEAKKQANENLVGDGGRIYPMYIPMENPAVLGGFRESQFDPTDGQDISLAEDYREGAEEEIREEYGLEEDDDISDYSDEVEQRMREGAENDGVFTNNLRDAVETVLGRYEETDVGQALEDLDSLVYEGGTLVDIELALRESEGVVNAADYDDDIAGGIAGHVIREIFEEMGYDGIIDRRVNEKFGSEKRIGTPMAGMDETTVHIIVPTDTKNRPISAISPKAPSFSLEVKESMKDVTKRTPEVVEAAVQYGAGKITLDEYNEIVAKADPIEPFTEVPAAATEEEIIGALKKDKVPFVGTENFTRKLTSGDRVGARLDIPAYKDHGVWVASVHEPRSGVSSGGAGAKIGYVPTVRLSNVNFATNPLVAYKIATGQVAKNTIATVEGDWVEQSDGMSEAEANDVLNDPSWVQVGMNPFRHSYFYDRSRNTGAPVVSAEEVIQVGGLVLAKNPVYAPKNDPRFKIMQGKTKPAALERAGVSDLDATFSLEAVDTPAFKSWFGDSKVVNENGEPMVMYHGTPSFTGIEKFNKPATISGAWSPMRGGIWFTPSKRVADNYAMGDFQKNDTGIAFGSRGSHLVPVYLKMENPLDLRTKKGRDNWKRLKEDTGVSNPLKHGYDGVILSKTEFVVAEPTQIKSAIANRGTFDPADPRINYSLEPLSEQDADAIVTERTEEIQSRTPERQAFIDYQRELRKTQLDNTEEEKKKLQKLLQLATDADEIEALKQAGDEKIIRVVEQKVKQIRKQAAEREDVTESVKALERLINSPEVPMEVRARMRGFGRLAERKTPQGKARWVEQMANKLEAEIDRHYRTRNVRTLRSLLRPFATEYAPNRRKLRERVGEEARADLNFAQRLLNNSEATPPEGMTDERRDELVDIFGDVGNRQSNPTRVKAALEIAGSIAKGGRTARDEVKEDRRQRNEQVGDLVREEVLNGEQAMGKSQIAAREKQRNVFKKGYDYMRSRLIRGMEGFQQQLNKMDSVKGGILEDLFLPAVYQADQNEKALNREHVERVNEDFKTVLGTDDRQAASWYKNSHELHDTDIEWIEDKAIGMEKRTISKQQGVSVLMQWLDPSLRSTFSNMGINEATIEQIKEFIGEIGVSEAYYFRERYAEMGIKLNAKHMEVEGIPLDMIDGYGGRARRINSVGSRQEDMQMFSTNSAGRPTVKSGSMKERTNSTDYLIFQDAAMDFSAHAKEVNHYISHAELAKNLSAAFLNNARARNAITQKHGADFYDSLKEQVEAIIEGDPKITNKTDRDWNRIRSNVTKAQLMAKPAILIKQLTSAPAFVEEIGPVAYAKAAASLTRNARKFMPMIWGSEYVKNRMSNSQFADIQQQLDQRDNTLKGLRWDDYAMMNVKWGDIGAVIAGGAPVYVHAYNEAKAAGMTNDQAQVKAEEVFGLASERAQQSSATHAKGAFLRGKGAARTWFMYLTSPLQYQRNVNTGIANLVANVFEKKAGRKSEVKKAANQALRAIVIYHVILPQIFQAVASGLVGFTDDEDYIKEQFWAKQRRAAYAGNLNAIPLAGQLITVLANLAAGTGESWDSSGSPIIDLVGEIKQDFEKAVKNGEDLSAWLELSSSVGLAAGYPVKTINNYYDAITDISEGNTEHPFLRAGGWSKWSIFED